VSGLGRIPGHVLDRNYRGPAKSHTLLALLTNPAYHYDFKHPRRYEQRFDQLDQIGEKLVDTRHELHRPHHAYPPLDLLIPFA
jgi:hypothetical protein